MTKLPRKSTQTSPSIHVHHLLLLLSPPTSSLLLRNLSTALFPLPRKERQPFRRRIERDDAALGKIKYIPRLGVHLLSRLVRNEDLAFENHLHLVVRVLVDQVVARLEAVQAACYRLFGVDLVAAGNELEPS